MLMFYSLGKIWVLQSAGIDKKMNLKKNLDEKKF